MNNKSNQRIQPEAHVVVCAVACHPDHGSELAVGWQWVLRASERYRVTVITADSRGSRAAIETYRAMHPSFAEKTRFVFLAPFDSPPSVFLRRLRHHIPLLYYRAYRRWLKDAAAIAAGVVTEEHVDCVHQLTYITFREPGYLMHLPAPFAWGPIGGTQNIPWRFLLSLGLTAGLRNAARNVINNCQFVLRRDVAVGMRKAAVLSAVASDTQSRIKTVFRRESMIIPATACALPARPSETPSTLGEPVRFVFTGAFVARKGLPFALRSLALLKDLNWTLDIIGGGRLELRWRALSHRLGIADRCRFHGSVPRLKAIEIMGKAAALVFPSLQEGWPTVVMESLALGVPVITTAHHGMVDMVTPECGFLIPLTTPRRLVANLAEALRTIAEDPKLRNQLAAGAARQASKFSAENHAAAIHKFYQAAINHG